MKIKYKMILAMYLVIIPILIVVSSYMFFKNYHETVDDMSNVYENLTKTVDENIGYLQSDILDLSTYITINSDIRYILNSIRRNLDGNRSLIWEKNAPTDFLRDMLSIKSHIKTLIIYAENGVKPFYISRDSSVHNTNIYQVHNLDLYQNALAAKGDQVWSRVNANEDGLYLQNKSDKIVISRVLFDWAKKRRIGYLAIGIEASRYEQICSSAIQQENEGIVVYSQNGQELVQVGKIDEKVLDYIKDYKVSGNDGLYFEYHNNYVFYSSSGTNKNTVYYILPKENWLTKIQNAKLFPIIFGVALLICLWPLSVIASTIISKPLRKLYHSMVKFKEGDFEQQISVVGRDEIGEVTSCFNQMVKDIKELIDTNYVIALRERQSELDALQAQINPHFLYNTLDSLYWQALNAGSDKLAEDIFSLSQLFRIVLSQGQTIITIEKEKELIYHYLQIQKMRFEKKLDYLIDIDDSILNYRIPKLILQPFVENAIVHGLECSGRRGIIEISGQLVVDHIVFEIKDNGVGMSKEQLSEIFEQREAKEYSSQRIGRYAIKNVKERLNLKYHSDFRLDITSQVGIGTVVTIMIPARMDIE
jgi:two-component system sensor histidine kinase YesM